MKTPLRGEMLRGADFIIGVVSARGSDQIQIVFYNRPKNKVTKKILHICQRQSEMLKAAVVLNLSRRDSLHICFHWTPGWVLKILKTQCLD